MAYSRRGSPAPQGTDEILGVWARTELDDCLPAWPDFGGEAGSNLPTGVRPDESSVRILEAFLKEDPLSGSPDKRTFFPVFGAAEAGGSPSQAMRELREARPRSVRKSWFVGDPERGIVFG